MNQLKYFSCKFSLAAVNGWIFIYLQSLILANKKVSFLEVLRQFMQLLISLQTGAKFSKWTRYVVLCNSSLDSSIFLHDELSHGFRH